jgi:hypothetical protein
MWIGGMGAASAACERWREVSGARGNSGRIFCCGLRLVRYLHQAMPTVLRERGYRFFFYMADRLEPAHIHVERDDSAAKVWLDPLEFSFVEGFREHECNEILRITDAHLDEFLRAWYVTFGGLQP